ncbi:DNA polymerase subunit gamma-1-like [Acropora palmata]|uniref:DNA polymerase subunit gamma-1-like n=1 Tax=Acropora palmata TaxID=6131 RepID=UPI003DA06CF1
MYRSLQLTSRKVRQLAPTIRIFRARRLSRCCSTTSASQNASLQREEQKRFNPLEIQMLSSSLHDQVFHGEIERYDPTVVKKCQEHLKVHNLWSKSGSVLPEVDFQLPPLLGKNVDEHFRKIAEELGSSYFKKAQMLADLKLSAIPEEWSFSPGWTKYAYSDNGPMMSSVDVPEEDALIFDVEVCINAGPFPVIAVGASSAAWYCWLSPRLFEDKSYQWLLCPTPELYIPLELPTHQDWKEVEWKERLVVGHSIGFDRSFIKEQYYIKGPKTYFLDTLSLHMCISGFTSLQRSLWESANAGRIGKVPWMLVGSGNKLTNLHQLYCGSDGVDKSLVKIFVEGSLDDVKENFQDLVTYCAKDTAATQEVFAALWPKFLHRFPHPVSFAGMLEMGSAYLPVDRSWENYIRDADDTYEDLEKEMKCSLMKLADDCCNYLHGERYKDDPWLWEMDWSVQEIRTKKLKTPKTKKKKTNSQTALASDEKCSDTEKLLTEEFITDLVGEDEVPFDNNIEAVEGLKNSSDILATIPPAVDVMYKRRQNLPGYPKWYRSLCIGPSDKEEWKEGPVNISPQCQVAPMLLRMTWDGFPLHYNRKHGWGYLVPGRTDNLATSNQIDAPENEEDMMEYKQPEAPFPTKAFENLWKNHRMNKTLQSDNADANCDNDTLDVYTLNEDHLWTTSELEEMKKPKRTQGEKSTVALDKTNNGEGDIGVDCSKRVSRSKGRGSSLETESRPDFYHGVGPCNDVNLPGVWFFRIPHKNGENYRCGNPLAKDYISKIEDGTLVASGNLSAHKTLIINKMISSWRNAQKRIRSQLAVWFHKEDLPSEITRSNRYSADNTLGAILPRVITAGTVTRRAVEPTWLTASNPREDRVGSELKSMVRAPPGYCLVGADVDSQELWIAAILGDAHFAGMHGSTAFGWMTLQGRKSEGTDLHSKTAETIGISRDHAKIFNYGRIYGAGQKYAEKLLLQFNHRLTEKEAHQKAATLYANTKGVAKFLLTDFGKAMAEKFGFTEDIDENGCVASKVYYQLLRKTSRKGRSTANSIDNGRRWCGGSESHMFNKLESIAQSEEPRTPVLGCRISRSLEPSAVGNEFMTSRVNWVVQSSAVDYLHLMLVCMKWLFNKYNIDGRFCISIHDEVRYLVASKDKYRAALALQITNLLTRAMFAHKLGMSDLPQSVAFFSAVDIDTVLRKEVTLDCKTPSNPLGLHKGQGIPPGQALDIYNILKLTRNGVLEEDLVKEEKPKSVL